MLQGLRLENSFAFEPAGRDRCLDYTKRMAKPDPLRLQPSAARGAVTYARVSSKEQDKEGYSIPAQTKLMKEYARVQGFKIAREYVDVETAKQTGRASFGKMAAILEMNVESYRRKAALKRKRGD